MRKYKYILFALIGLISLLSSCKKDETKVVIKENPTAPSLTTVPDLELKRTEASRMLQFAGTAADFGFSNSVTYYLEADIAGNQFRNPIIIASNNRRDTMNISATDLDALLIRTLPPDSTIAMQLRIRASLAVETSNPTPIEVISDPVAANITTYGPAKLTLTTAGTLQQLTSPTDNKIYTGWIYTDGTPLLFTNFDDGKIYGGSFAALTEGGAAIALPAGGYDCTVNLNTTGTGSMTFGAVDQTICMIGNATPGGWGTDTRMVWNFTDHTWNLTITLVAGGLKFRTAGGWAHVNVAYNPAGHDLSNLYQSLSGADSQNIDNIGAGTFDVKLSLATTPMWAIFTAH